MHCVKQSCIEKRKRRKAAAIAAARKNVKATQNGSVDVKEYVKAAKDITNKR